MPKPKNQTKPTAAPAAAAPQVDERAVAIAELVRGGMSYSEAKAAIDNDRPAAAPEKVDLGKDPGADEVIDPDSILDEGENLETVEYTDAPPEGDRMIDYLYELRNQLGRARVKKNYRVTFTLDHRLFDWMVYSTIGEAQYRGRADLTIEDFLKIKIKELKAADPTGGGRRDPRSSGPRELYNPQSGGWKP